MARGGTTTRFDVIIAAKVKNEAAAGAASTNSTVDKMLRQQLRAIEQANRQQAADAKRTAVEIAQVEAQQARREIAARQAAAKEFQRAESEKVRAAERSAAERLKIEQRNHAAVLSLQRQRHSALTQQWNREQREFARLQSANAKAAAESAARQSAAQEASWGMIKIVALAALAAIGAALVGLGVAISRAASFERLEMGLATMMGSAEKAREEIVKLKEVAKLPGLGFREAVQGSVALQALGFNAERARKLLLGFGNAVAFTGGKEQLGLVITQITQMASAGKVIMQDLRPIIQQAPVAGRALREAFGTISPKELNEMTGSVDVFIDKWVEALLKLPKAPNAAANAFENLSDSWDRFLISVGKPFLPAVSASLDTLAPLLERVGTALGAMLSIFAGAPSVLGVATLALSAFAAAVFFASTSAIPSTITALLTMVSTLKLVGQVMIGTASLIQGATATMTVFALGWGAVVLAIGAVIIALTNETTAAEKANAITLEMTETQTKALASAQLLAAEGKKVADTHVLLAADYEIVEAILGRLDPATQTYIMSLRDEHTQIRALNIELERNAELQKTQVQAALRVTAGGIIQQLKQVEETSERIRGLEVEINRQQDLLMRSPNWAENLRPAIQNLSQDVLDHKVKRDDLSKSLSENQAKLITNAQAMGMNTQQFQQFLKEAGFASGQIDLLTTMYGALTPKVDSTTDAMHRQAAAIKDVADELKGLLSVGDLEIETKILDLVKKASEQGLSAAEARRLAADQASKGTILRKLISDRDRNREIEKSVREVFEPKPISKSTVDRHTREQELISSMKEFGADLADAFKEEFGKSLNMRFGQTAFHAGKLKLDHRAAIDIPGLDIRTLEGQFVKEFAESRGVKAWFAPGAMTNAAGQTISTGKHAHLGEFSRGLGKPLRLPQGLQAEGLLSAKGLERFIEKAESPFAGMNLQQIAKLLRETVPSGTPQTITTKEPEMIESLGRQWELYYDRISEREAEVANRRKDFADEYFANQRNLALDLENIEIDLAHFRKQNADDQFVEQRRLLSAKDEELNLLREMAQVQDELATGPYNESLRIQLALLQDIADIRRRDEDAIKAQNRAQLELADAEVFHGERARANVLDHLARTKSQTELFSDAIIGAYDAVNDVVLKGVQKITGGIRVLDNLIAGLISRLANRLFQKLLDVLIPSGSATGGAQSGGGILGGIFGGGGSSGGGVGGFIRSIFGGGTGAIRTPPFAGGAAPASLSGLLSGLVGGTSPMSLTGAQSGGWAEMGRRLGFPSSGGAGTSVLGGLGSSLGALAPLLGAGLGVGIGGQSRFGQVLGGIGGGIAGLGIAALLGSSGAAGMLGSIGTLGGLLPFALPIFPIAAGLLIGAYFLARNAQRKKDEKTRNQATIDTRSALWAILAAVQTDQMDGNTARSEITKLHQNWIEVGNSLKDSKTRRHHMETWNHFQPIIDSIEKEIAQQTTRSNNRNRMVPVFASGGISSASQLIKVTPGEGVKYPGSNLVNTVQGRDRGYDSEYMYAPKGTRIIPQSEMKQSRGFAGGGVVGEAGSMLAPNIAIEINIDKDGIAHAVITSPSFKPAVIHNVKVGRVEKKL